MKPHARLSILFFVTLIMTGLAGAASALDAPADLGVLDGYTHSVARAVNESGQVVGMSYNDAFLGGRAFIWLPEPAYGMTAGIHDLGMPSGFASSDAVDINAHGQVVGRCEAAGEDNRQAFIWLPEAAYGLTAGLHLLNGLPDQVGSYAVDINDAGQVVCESDVNVGEEWPEDQGYIWQNGVATALTMADGTPITFTTDSAQRCLNENGQVVGVFEEFLSPEDLYPIERVALWDDGTATAVSPEDSYCRPVAINGNGEVVGMYGELHDVFLWLPQAAYGLTAGCHLLADEAGRTVVQQIFAYDMNDAGQIVGWDSTGSQWVPDASGEGEGTWIPVPGKLWIWENGAFTDIATISDQVAKFTINGSGQVAGYSEQATWNDEANQFVMTRQGYFWSEATGMQILQTLGGADIQVFDLADTGEVVGGSSLTDETAFHACSWDGGVAPPAPTVTLSDVTLTARNAKVLTVTVMINNPNDDTAYNVTVTAATLGGVETNSNLPLIYGAIKAADNKKCTLQFKNAPSGEQTLTVTGSSSLGDFSIDQTVTVP